jgi:DNA-binding winged helix-turn-helix (wHTH) protein/Tol biopolymer transport system component
MMESFTKSEQETRNGNGRNGNGKIRFGAFEADLHSGAVSKLGSRIKLQDQPFKVLQVLLERPGELVSREELQSRIWPDDNFGDFDHAVNVAIGKLRIALGDSADNPTFIETVPRRGYRFMAKLETVPMERPAAAPPVPEVSRGRLRVRGRTPMPIIVAFVAIAGVLGLGILVGRRSVASRPMEFDRLTVRHGTIYAARFVPGGHDIVYSASWDGMPIEVFSSDLKSPAARRLELPTTQLLGISGTGEMAVLQLFKPGLMLTVRGTLGIVPFSGGVPRQVAENVEWADWSPDGKSLAIVRELGGKRRLEFPLGHALYETSGWIGHPRISPKGSQIAFLDHPTNNDDRGMVSVVDLDGQKRALSAGWESEEGLAWSPDGTEVWFSAAQAGLDRRIFAVDMAGHQRLVYRGPGGITLQDIAADGRVLLTRDDQKTGIMGLARGAKKERDLSWLDWSLPSSLSADGNTLLFDEQGEQSGPNYTVATRDMQGSPPVPLGEGMSGDLSPDGKWAAATVSYSQLVLLPTGAGTLKRIDRADIQQYGHEVHWLPDGKQIVFSANQAGHDGRCFIQNVDGGKPRPVTPEGVSVCKLSPDGKLIAGAGIAAENPQFYPMDGSPPKPIPGLMPRESYSWTSDPRYLYVSDWRETPGTPVKVFRLNILNGQRTFFKEIAPADLAGLCGMSKPLFSADGQAYVYEYTRLYSELYLVNGLK